MLDNDMKETQAMVIIEIPEAIMKNLCEIHLKNQSNIELEIHYPWITKLKKLQKASTGAIKIVLFIPKKMARPINFLEELSNDINLEVIECKQVLYAKMNAKDSPLKILYVSDDKDSISLELKDYLFKEGRLIKQVNFEEFVKSKQDYTNLNSK